MKNEDTGNWKHYATESWIVALTGPIPASTPDEIKCGDKVRVKSLRWYNRAKKNEYGDINLGDNYFFSADMVQYCGEVFTVREANPNRDSYSLDDDMEFGWHRWMLEDKVAERKLGNVDIDISKLNPLWDTLFGGSDSRSIKLPEHITDEQIEEINKILKE